MGHSTPEWVFVGVVVAILIYVGAESWRVEHSLEFAPPNSETVRVIGQQWFWSFEHADGTKEVNELHLKEGVPYRFEIVSNDVIHDFAVPDFAVLMDAVPGRVNTLWNIFDKPGSYLIECREYCGMLHQNMRATLFVEPNEGANLTRQDTPAPGRDLAEPQPRSSSIGEGAGTAQIKDPNYSGSVSQGAGTLQLVAPGNITESNQSASTPAGQSAGGGGGAAGNQTGAASGPALTIPAGASTQGNPSYEPAAMTAKKGDTITVTNDDTVPHTATSGTGPEDPNSGKSFDTSIIMAAESGKIDTSQLAAGEYPFYCSVHPFMKGKLTVQ
jgi:cytochrome c oxidase subunit 2